MGSSFVFCIFGGNFSDTEPLPEDMRFRAKNVVSLQRAGVSCQSQGRETPHDILRKVSVSVTLKVTKFKEEK